MGNKGTSPKLQCMARFRNRLVHRFWGVGNKCVVEVSRQNVTNLEVCLRAIEAFLQTPF